MSGDGEEGIYVARHGSWSTCDRLESHDASALAEESEMRCGHALKVCDRLESFEGGGAAICCWTHALFSPFYNLCVDFLNDASFCDSLISSRLSLLHHSCSPVEAGRSCVSSQVCLSFFDRLRTQSSISAYGFSYYQSPTRGPTYFEVLSMLFTTNPNICPQMPRRPSRLILWRLQRLKLRIK